MKMTELQKLKRENTRLKRIIFKYWHSTKHARSSSGIWDSGVCGDNILFGFEMTMGINTKDPQALKRLIEDLYLHKEHLKEKDLP